MDNRALADKFTPEFRTAFNDSVGGSPADQEQHWRAFLNDIQRSPSLMAMMDNVADGRITYHDNFNPNPTAVTNSEAPGGPLSTFNTAALAGISNPDYRATFITILAHEVRHSTDPASRRNPGAEQTCNSALLTGRRNEDLAMTSEYITARELGAQMWSDRQLGNGSPNYRAVEHQMDTVANRHGIYSSQRDFTRIPSSQRQAFEREVETNQIGSHFYLKGISGAMPDRPAAEAFKLQFALSQEFRNPNSPLNEQLRPGEGLLGFQNFSCQDNTGNGGKLTSYSGEAVIRSPNSNTGIRLIPFSGSFDPYPSPPTQTPPTPPGTNNGAGVRIGPDQRSSLHPTDEMRFAVTLDRQATEAGSSLRLSMSDGEYQNAFAASVDDSVVRRFNQDGQADFPLQPGQTQMSVSLLNARDITPDAADRLSLQASYVTADGAVSTSQPMTLDFNGYPEVRAQLRQQEATRTAENPDPAARRAESAETPSPGFA